MSLSGQQTYTLDTINLFPFFFISPLNLMIALIDIFPSGDRSQLICDTCRGRRADVEMELRLGAFSSPHHKILPRVFNKNKSLSENNKMPVLAFIPPGVHRWLKLFAFIDRKI